MNSRAWKKMRTRSIRALPKKLPFKVGDKVLLTKKTSIGKRGEWAVITDIELSAARKNPEWWRGRAYIRILIRNKPLNFDWVDETHIVRMP